MDLEIRVNGYRCNEETDGIGDDEILFLFATAPVDKGQRNWSYADRYSACEWRFKDDVDTGESVSFGYPNGGVIAIKHEIDDNRALEVWFLIAEVDGGGVTTRSEAGRAYATFRSQMAERIEPGNIVGQTPRRWNQPSLGNTIQTIGFDIWSVDLALPLGGAMEPDQSIGGWAITAPSGADAVYKNPKDSGTWLSETRSYRSDSLDARYTFEVEYRIVTSS